MNMKCPICGSSLPDDDREQCKECGRQVHKKHLKHHVCCECGIASIMLFEKLERKGYLKTK